MGKETVLFKSEEKQSTAEVADFLRELADRVAGGEVILRQGDQELVLHLPEQVTLEVKAEEETTGGGSGVKHSLEVELEWKPGADGRSGALELG